MAYLIYSLCVACCRALASLLHAHNTCVLFVDSARDQLWTKWCCGPIPQVKQARALAPSALHAQPLLASPFCTPLLHFNGLEPASDCEW